MGCAATLAVLLFIFVAAFKIGGQRDSARRKAELEAHLAKRLAHTPNEPDLEVIATRAFLYSGPVYFKVNSGKRLVAIDLEIHHGGPWFNIDHFEILNGKSGRSYGDKPHIIPLSELGEPLPEGMVTPTSKVRLVYQVPKACDTINLGFTGSKLLKEPMQVAVA